jgi:hypothetical protein
MSLSHEAMLELMALVDGELHGEAKERAENLAARDEEARRLVEAMRATGVRTWLNETVEMRTRAADGIADEVMARIDGGPSRMPITRLRRGSRVMMAQAIVASALAIAAGIAIYVRSGAHGREFFGLSNRAPVASVRNANGVTLASSVEVDEIDSAGHVSIFEISANANSAIRSSVVVWIDDETGEN